MESPVLEVKNISKRFGGIIALDKVSFSVKKGEVLCLLGENGAGKSTMINIISGIYAPDEGEICLEGSPVVMKNPFVAHQLGVSTVYQELVQYPDLNIMENLFSGRYDTSFGLIRKREMYEKTQALMDQVGIHFDPTTYVRDLSVAQRQLVEILKALSYDAKIIIFDEPSASLTADETQTLFRIINRLKEEGRSIIYISHRLEEVSEIGDRLVVLKDGKNSGQGLVKDLDHEQIIRMMVGRSLEKRYPERGKSRVDAPKIMSIHNLSTRKIQDVSFDLHEGEILGIGGLVGSGRTELVHAIVGIDKAVGSIEMHDRPIKNQNPAMTLRNKIAVLPEDRKGQGLVPILTVMHNIGLSSLRELSRFGFMKKKKELDYTKRYIQFLHIRTTGPSQPVEDLSGGNQQKIVLAKCLATEPDILILDEPTRGIDVGTKTEIYQLMKNYVNAGHAIIMISSELPELLGMSDRILLMSEGKLVGEIEDVAQATEEQVMRIAVQHNG